MSASLQHPSSTSLHVGAMNSASSTSTTTARCPVCEYANRATTMCCECAQKEIELHVLEKLKEEKFLYEQEKKQFKKRLQDSMRRTESGIFAANRRRDPATDNAPASRNLSTSTASLYRSIEDLKKEIAKFTTTSERFQDSVSQFYFKSLNLRTGSQVYFLTRVPAQKPKGKAGRQVGRGSCFGFKNHKQKN
ncbi:unnamed protein product [Amoebophrya sp. A120]|nr:unnamed protein product [Amoebophrya sp. A120]|eukprot:GSA120T00009812001.1